MNATDGYILWDSPSPIKRTIVPSRDDARTLGIKWDAMSALSMIMNRDGGRGMNWEFP